MLLEQQEEAAQHLLLSPMTTLSHKSITGALKYIKYNHSSQVKMYSKLDVVPSKLYSTPDCVVTLILPDCTVHVG
jgi:hypothetical protein